MQTKYDTLIFLVIFYFAGFETRIISLFKLHLCMEVCIKPSKKVIPFKRSGEFFTTAQRSRMMSSVKTKNTGAEMILRRTLWKK